MSFCLRLLQSKPRSGISVRYHPALLGLDAVRVAWPGAVCSFDKKVGEGMRGKIISAIFQLLTLSAVF